MAETSARRATQRRDLTERADVLIGGGGFAGLGARASRCARGSAIRFKVTVADPALGRSHAGDARASAIAAAARRLFETIGVWDEVADRRAADPRHGRHRLQAAGRDAADLSDVRRRGRAGRAVRAHDRESGAGRCAGRAGQGGRRRASRRCGDRLRSRRRIASTCSSSDGDGHRREASGRRRRRALGDPRGGRHPQRRLELRSVRHRHHRGARARPSRPRRGAFPAGGAVRDPAAEGQALVDRVDRGRSARPSASSRCRTTNSTPSWNAASA